MTTPRAPIDVALLGTVGPSLTACLAALETHPKLRATACASPRPGGPQVDRPALRTVSAGDLTTVRDVDAVLVLGAPDAELLTELVRSGKHLLVAPEVVATVAEARHITRLAADGGGSVRPALPDRFEPEALTASSLVDGDDLGEIVFARAALLGTDGPSPQRRLDRDPRVEVAAESRAAAVVDVVRGWFPGPPTTVHAQRGPAATEASSYIVTTAQFSGGRSAICESQASAGGRQPAYRELFLQGSTGMASLPWDASATLVMTDGSGPRTATSHLDVLRRVLDDWAASMLGRGSPSVGSDDLATIVGLRHAIGWSLANQRPADVATHLSDEEEQG